MGNSRGLIFLDLDGTLIDSRRRMHGLFRHLVTESTLDFEAYWELKRRRLTHADILRSQHGYETHQLVEFEDAWLRAIEEADWLALDAPFASVASSLGALGTHFDLILLTARQSVSAATQQLNRLGLTPYLNDILVTEAKRSKLELVNERFPGLGLTDWVVGDTPEDVRTGRALGVRTAAVLSGFVGREILARENPDALVEDVREFASLCLAEYD